MTDPQRKDDETMSERKQWEIERDALTAEMRRATNWAYSGRCVVCGTRQRPEIDHIVPISLGGRSVGANLWVLCHQHNAEKGAQWPVYWAQGLYDDHIWVATQQAKEALALRAGRPPVRPTRKAITMHQGTIWPVDVRYIISRAIAACDIDMSAGPAWVNHPNDDEANQI